MELSPLNAVDPSRPGKSALHANSLSEEAWIEVIHRMDSIYADLVRHQIELERKNEALEEAQRFIDSVLSAMSDVLVVADPHGRIQRANRAMLDLAGVSEETLIGQALQVLFTEESRSLAEELPHQARENAITDREARMRGHHGEPVPIAINCSPRYDNQGVFSGIVLTGRQLGELHRAYHELQHTHQQLKDAQQQLLQAEKMASLGRLVAGVAHELNNPISFVFGNMHALKRYEDRLQRYLSALHENRSPVELEKLRKRLKIDRVLQDIGPLIDGSLEGAERISAIVQNLRRFATPRPQSDNWFDLPRLAENAVGWITRTASVRPEVTLDLPSELPVYGNEGHVHQILLNLLQNAIDAMEKDPNPRLDIRVEHGAQQARVLIRDHGPGIPEAHSLKIFDPFFTTKEVGKGTGLGLYISYGLATDQCGGKLGFRNHPQGGAEFTLEIPLGKDGAPPDE